MSEERTDLLQKDRLQSAEDKKHGALGDFYKAAVDIASDAANPCLSPSQKEGGHSCGRDKGAKTLQALQDAQAGCKHKEKQKRLFCEPVLCCFSHAAVPC